MMNIFDGGFKKKQHPPELPIYGFCLSDLSMANNKEGGNETDEKIEGWRGSVSFVRRHAHIKQKAKRRKWESVKNSWEKA